MYKDVLFYVDIGDHVNDILIKYIDYKADWMDYFASIFHSTINVGPMHCY